MRVTSCDGTPIACWRSGAGPPLVLVHGTTADHTRWSPLLPHLEPHVTVYALDRRGRGASGDGAGYDIAREFEDVAAVVDAAARAGGEAVDVLGHSFGGLCALGAATLTPNVRRLLLYDPVVRFGRSAFPPDVEQRIDALVAAGEAEAALETFYRDVLLNTDDELRSLRALPGWQLRIAAAHTIPREFTAEQAGAFGFADARRVSVPALLLLGADSPAWILSNGERVAAALPDVRLTVLDGQDHVAIDRVPDVFAGHVLAFVREGR